MLDYWIVDWAMWCGFGSVGLLLIRLALHTYAMCSTFAPSTPSINVCLILAHVIWAWCRGCSRYLSHNFGFDTMLVNVFLVSCFHNTYVLKTCIMTKPLVTPMFLDTSLLALDRVALFCMFGMFMPRFACFIHVCIVLSVFTFFAQYCMHYLKLHCFVYFCTWLHCDACLSTFLNISCMPF